MEMLLGRRVILMFKRQRCRACGWDQRKAMRRTLPINKLETSFLATQEYSAWERNWQPWATTAVLDMRQSKWKMTIVKHFLTRKLAIWKWWLKKLTHPLINKAQNICDFGFWKWCISLETITPNTVSAHNCSLLSNVNYKMPRNLKFL